MSRLSPQAREHLAASYVLGTLTGPARRAFERRCEQDADLARRRSRWERAFADLQRGFTPVLPREGLWAQIEQRAERAPIRPEPSVSALARPASVPATEAPAGVTPVLVARRDRPGQPAPARAAEPSAPPVRGRSTRRSASAGVSPLWRVWAIAASLLATALGGVLGWQLTRPEPVPQVVEAPIRYVGVLTVDGGHWVVETVEGSGVLKIRTRGSPRIPARNAPELWWIGADGTPRSLGLLPREGEAERAIPALPGAEAPVFAVSLEPPTGSPSGKPTGRVITQFPALTDL